MASQRWTKELLARSQNTPLKISIGTHYPLEEWTDPFLEKVADHAEDIQELRLHLWSDSHKAWGLDPFLRPCSRAPRLQVLEIRGYNSFSLVQRTFHGETPSLRKLDLTAVDIPWHSFRLSALVSLNVMDIRHPFRPNTVELLSALSSAHDLVDLAFQDINLHHLSRLVIHAPLSTVVASLSCVNTPPKTNETVLRWGRRHYPG